MGEITYTQIVPSSNFFFEEKKDPNKGGLGSGVKLFAAAARWVHDEMFAKRVSEMKDDPSIIDRVNSLMPKDGGGVLIICTYQEWKVQDVNGFKAKDLKGMYVWGSAKNPEEALKGFINSDRLEVGAADGWVIKHDYFWATNDGNFARPITGKP
ncbi:hypothetical protein [Novosphingobium sp. KACC 22771]|uniref:hypothetical protein n=1 Tax=Novosphingobium sp. KACC 22771 TaxID=3025670 RepID=UPI002366EEAA|nr:hypothetical protein [Novosphingobium sp. KACC 22771]WDF71472.1 hypothetical protein PQ467_11710 [Novosphingobium sp. KACC 22771]